MLIVPLSSGLARASARPLVRRSYLRAATNVSLKLLRRERSKGGGGEEKRRGLAALNFRVLAGPRIVSISTSRSRKRFTHSVLCSSDAPDIALECKEESYTLRRTACFVLPCRAKSKSKRNKAGNSNQIFRSSRIAK